MSSVFFDALFDRLVKAYSLDKHRRTIDAIRDVLFSGFNPNVLVSFSFSKNNRGGLRFSYNNTAEQKALITKARRIFSLLGADYDQSVAKKCLGSVSPRATFRRIALGIDWPCDQSSPRVKIYLSGDTLGPASPVPCKSYAKTVATWLGWKSAFLDKTLFSDISVVAVDFFSGGTCGLTLYSRVPSAAQAPRDTLSPEGRRGWDRFTALIDKETRAFYGVARRWQEPTPRPHSATLHKIYEYEPDRMPDSRRANAEIVGVLKAFGHDQSLQAKLMQTVKDFAARKRVRSYPTAVSLDTDCRDASRLGVSYAFMPRSETILIKAPASRDLS